MNFLSVTFKADQSRSAGNSVFLPIGARGYTSSPHNTVHNAPRCLTKLLSNPEKPLVPLNKNKVFIPCTKLPPPSPQRMLSGLVIFRPPENESAFPDGFTRIQS